MNYSFELSEIRTIQEANYNTFIHPAIHPDRTMTDHDFLYIREGSWEIWLEAFSASELIRAQAGDLVILPAQLHHYGTSPCSPNCKNMYIHVSLLPGDHPVSAADNCMDSQSYLQADSDHLPCTDSHTMPDADSRMVFQNSTPDDTPADSPQSILLPSVIHCSRNTAIAEYFSDMITIYWSSSPWKTQKLSSLFNLLLCEIKEQQDMTPAALKHMDFVDSVAKFLQANPQSFFSASEVAAHFYVSERTLNNRFHEVYHQTLHAWQMEQKLEMVRQFLCANPGITLRETASNFGFYDEFHLSKAFKKQFGVAPKYLR